ncbi:LIM domain-containing protein 1 isoform X2 [Clupea harengus]|uniref:LIM domain-containing protein 1 n=1 Tax=Clupea harengus TaxID=7950 RepID=A0A6P8GSI2_CLUHA|nr:LIM domain-containing protein 1 isoform X2 [Clupea harengus]
MTTEPSFGTCVRCSQRVYGDGQACQAMGKLYHDSCFTCSACSQRLQKQPFYSVSGRLFCKDHFMYSDAHQSSESCNSCGFLIKDMVLQAMGKSYHPACFCCTVCHQSLEGARFCLDSANRVYCLKDYHRYVAPTCATCALPILPTEGSLVTERIVSMDRDYHVYCFH